MTEMRSNVSAISIEVNGLNSLFTRKKIFSLTHKVRPNYMVITRDLPERN